jgi:hypothetical protein
LAFAALAAPTDESEGAVAAIPVNDFEPRVTAIAEHKERPALQILVELACDHAREPRQILCAYRRASMPRIPVRIP